MPDQMCLNLPQALSVILQASECLVRSQGMGDGVLVQRQEGLPVHCLSQGSSQAQLGKGLDQ